MERNIADCGIYQSVNVLGSRYKLLVLRALIASDTPLRFGALMREMPGVSQKTLTRTLRDLEAAGLVNRTVFPEVPPRVEYGLEEAGRALMPVFLALHAWRETYPAIGQPDQP
ncbi:winged helix-turn-helix transcriptional regulator [Oricola sp.]|uniref:winged helix-turn-helix transcriptional regulator n=1 Tax=Oricola sp. TaxID=1979950 RepID=UPI003BAC640C